MNTDINLVSAENKETLQIEKLLFITRILAVVSLFLVLFSAIIIFILNFINPLSSIRNQQNAVLQNLTILKNKSADYALLGNRLQNIFIITSKRTDYTSDFDKIFSLATNGISADAISLTTNKVSFTVSSNSLLVMAGFLDGIFNLQDKKVALKNISIDNLMVNFSNSTYSLSISAQLL